MDKKIKEVFVKKGECQELAKIFDLDPDTISRMIRGKSNSKLAEKVRKVASERGGYPIYSNN